MKIFLPASKRRFPFPPILLALMIIQITGCETLRITTTGDHQNEWSRPKRVNRMFWGLANNKISIADPIFRYTGIQCIYFHLTTPQAIASVLTLGTYCPTNYCYRLAKMPTHDVKHTVAKYDSPARRQISDTTASGCHDLKLYVTGFTHDTVFHKSVLVNRMAWGLINSLNQNDKIPNSARYGGVQSMDIRMKFWERMVAFFSLGIYCPVTYTYKFAYLEDEYY